MKKIILWISGALIASVLGAALFLLARQARAAGEAERKWLATSVEALEELGSTSRLEILPL